ncbi:MAG TPA: Hpt domain-containing protein, partial [Dokdonella sp.]
LFDILQSEVAAHLGVVDDYLARCTPQPVVASEPLLRAAHTLNGAIAMVDIAVLGNVLGPLESYVKRLRGGALAPDAGGIDALRETAALTREVMQRLAAGDTDLPDSTALAERVAALRDALPEPDASPYAFTDVSAPASGAEETRFGTPPRASATIPEPEIDDPTGIWLREAGRDLGETPTLPRAPIPAELVAALAGFDANALSRTAAAEVRDNDDANTGAAAPEPAPGESAQTAHAPSSASDDGAPPLATADEPTAAEADRSAPHDDDASDAKAAWPSAFGIEVDDALDRQAPLDGHAPAGPAAAAQPPSPELAAADAATRELPSSAETVPEPASHEPATSESAAVEPAASGSAPSEPMLPEPMPPEPTPSEPPSSELAMPEPTTHDSAPFESATAESASEPAASDAAAREPVRSESTSPEPAAAFAPPAAAGTGEPRAAEPPFAAAAPAQSDAAHAPAALEGAPAPPLADDPQPDGPLEGVDIDDDLLEIFAQEAADILDQADARVAGLREAPHERAHVAGLQRDLHTLKGGARMAGLAPIGDLSHAMESLIDAVGEGRRLVDRTVVESLERGFDRLHGLLQRAARRRAIAMPQHAIARFEALVAGTLDAEAAADAASAADVAPADAAPAFDAAAAPEAAPPVEIPAAGPV